MEEESSAAVLAAEVEEDTPSEGYIEDLDDLLRPRPPDISLRPQAPQVFTRKQLGMGGGPLAEFERCKDRTCRPCREPDCNQLMATRNASTSCILCHHGSSQLCLNRKPCQAWSFDKLHQFREAQDAHQAVGGIPDLKQMEEGNVEGEEDQPGQGGAWGGISAPRRGTGSLDGDLPGPRKHLSGVTPRMTPSPSQKYQSTPRGRNVSPERPLRRGVQQQDLSQMSYRGERLGLMPKMTQPFILPSFWTEGEGGPQGGARKKEEKKDDLLGPYMYSTPLPKKDVKFSEVEPRGAAVGTRSPVGTSRPSEEPPQSKPPSENSEAWDEYLEGRGESAAPPLPHEMTLAKNQEKIVNVLELVAEKLGGVKGEMRAGPLRLPNLSLPSPKRGSNGRVETKEYHLWKIALKKTVKNNNLSGEAVLAIYSSNVKLTTEDWMATFQASPDLETALERLDTMHAPIQHLYGQLIRQITESPTMHGFTTKERIYQLNLLVQYTEEFITFFGASADLNREHTMIVLAKIAESKEARDMSLRHIYGFDEAYRRGEPYAQSLKRHLVEIRLLAVDLEAALETISAAEGRINPLRSAAVVTEEYKETQRTARSPPERTSKDGGSKTPRPPAECLQCPPESRRGHMTYRCNEMKKIKAGTVKLKKGICVRCLGKVEEKRPHPQDCGIKRMCIDNVFVLLKFTCDHDNHVKICPNKSCVDAKPKKTLDPDQTKKPPSIQSFAHRVVTLASSSSAEGKGNDVAFLKEVTAIRGKDGTTLPCLVYFDTMGSRSFIRCKEGSLPTNFNWVDPVKQAYSITTINGEQVVERTVHEVQLVTVKGLKRVTAVEGGLDGDRKEAYIDKQDASKHGVDALDEKELSEPKVTLILGSDFCQYHPRLLQPPRGLARKYPGLMLAKSEVSNRLLFFGPVNPAAKEQRAQQA